jgi:hypothetical protein
MKKHDVRIENIQMEKGNCNNESFSDTTVNGTQFARCFEKEFVIEEGHKCLCKANKESDSSMISCEKVLNETLSFNSKLSNSNSLPKYQNRRNIANENIKRTKSIKKKPIQIRKGRTLVTFSVLALAAFAAGSPSYGFSDHTNENGRKSCCIWLVLTYPGRK